MAAAASLAFVKKKTKNKTLETLLSGAPYNWLAHKNKYK